MPDAATLSVFAVAATALVLIPGPAVLYIVARSVDQGRAAGLASVLGVGAGNLVQVGAAALGLSALIASSGVAFDVIRIAGGLYLIWLGISRLRAADDVAEPALASRQPLTRTFWQGAVVAVLNPKTALFFVAFLPQFVDPSGTVWMQIALLGAAFVVLALITDSGYAIAAGSIADRMRRTGRGASWLAGSRYATAAICFGLGVLALVGARRTP